MISILVRLLNTITALFMETFLRHLWNTCPLKKQDGHEIRARKNPYYSYSERQGIGPFDKMTFTHILDDDMENGRLNLFFGSAASPEPRICSGSFDTPLPCFAIDVVSTYAIS